MDNIEEYNIENDDNANNNQNQINYSNNFNFRGNYMNVQSPQNRNFGNSNLYQNQQQIQRLKEENNQDRNNYNSKFRHFPYHDYSQEKNILYISDLPYNTNETDIKWFLKKYGDNITLVTINQKFHSEYDTRPISAKVIFKDYATANQARLEMNLRKFKGHAIRLMWEERDNSVRYNSTTNLFIKGIPFNVEPREVYEYFLKFGDISSAKLKENNEGNLLGYGYITYYKPESAESAIRNTNGKIIWGGGPIQVDYFKKKSERLSTSGPEVFKLYITNIPGDFTENNIIELTKEFGPILSCSIKTEKIGRRYALVCFENEGSAIRAKDSLEGKNLFGYNLFCKMINDKSFGEDYPSNKIKKNNNIQKRFFIRPNPGYINSNNNMCNLLVKNIPYMIKEPEFKEIFSKYGKIISAKLVTYNLITNIGGKTVSTPTSKGFGYVCYEDQETAKEVKNKLNNQFLPGYEHWKDPLIIDFFLSKSQKEMSEINKEKNPYNYYPNTYISPIIPQYMENKESKENSKENKENRESNDNKSQEKSFSLNYYNSLNGEENRKEYLGEIIYEKIINSPLLEDIPMKDKAASKITGMLLNLENKEQTIRIITDEETFNYKIFDALELLKESNYDYTN